MSSHPEAFDSHFTINNSPIPVRSKIKVPVVIIDSKLNVGSHVWSTNDTLKKRNDMLKTIAGSHWGCAKEGLAVTYKAIGRSVLNLTVGAPICASTIPREASGIPTVTTCKLQTLIFAQLLALKKCLSSMAEKRV